jgi:hypothetical protein
MCWATRRFVQRSMLISKRAHTAELGWPTSWPRPAGTEAHSRPSSRLQFCREESGVGHGGPYGLSVIANGSSWVHRWSLVE